MRPQAGFSGQFDGYLSDIGSVQHALHSPAHSSVLCLQCASACMSSSQQNVTELPAVTFCIACAERPGARSSAVHLTYCSRLDSQTHQVGPGSTHLPPLPLSHGRGSADHRYGDVAVFGNLRGSRWSPSKPKQLALSRVCWDTRQMCCSLHGSTFCNLLL